MEKKEAERKLQELKRRRNDTESEELEKMKQKQQDAEVELEGLKKKREERRRIMEEEERQKKQELEEKKAREMVRGTWSACSRLDLSMFLTQTRTCPTGREEEDEGGNREKEG